MKKLLQKTLTIIGLLFIYYCNISAQAFSATYTYDLTGNRIKETVIYMSTNIDQSLIIHLDTLIKNDTLSQDTTKFPQEGWVKGPVDSSSNMTITIYPNPTHGILLVEISGVDPDKLSSGSTVIKIWDMQRREINNLKPLGSYNSVDLSLLSNGTYIIGISVNGSNKNYKVIKN